jgi:hypothetical protein
VARRLTAREVAERAGCPVEVVAEVVRLGILEPGGDGRFDLSDAHLVRLMAAFAESGISLEDVAAGFASGDLTYSGMGAYFAEPAPVVGTYAEVAERIGRPFQLVVVWSRPSAFRSRIPRIGSGRTRPGWWSAFSPHGSSQRTRSSSSSPAFAGTPCGVSPSRASRSTTRW